MNQQTLPNGWQWKKLGEVIQLQRGYDLPKQDRKSGTIPIIGSNGRIDTHNIAKVKGAGVITGRSGSIGYIHYEEEDFFPLNTALYVKNFFGNYPRYIYYLLISVSDEIKKLASFSAVPTLDRKNVHENIVTALPPLEEQKRIVAKIDAAFEQLDEAIALQKANITRTETLKKALLVEQFSELPYEKKKLGEVSTLITKGSSPNWQGVNYVEKSDVSVLFVTSENVGSYDILTKNMKYVEEKFNKIEPRSILKKGDILMNIVGASIGRTAMYNLDEIANINQAVCLIRLNSKVFNSIYALHFFNSPICIEFMFDKQVDNARANLSMASIKNFEIPLPPLAEQEKIVAYLDKSFAEIDKMLAAQQGRLVHLESMKKAILQEAFEGKL